MTSEQYAWFDATYFSVDLASGEQQSTANHLQESAGKVYAVIWNKTQACYWTLKTC